MSEPAWNDERMKASFSGRNLAAAKLMRSQYEAIIAELERAAVAHVRQVDNMQATIDEMLASDFGKMSERIAELEGELEELKAIVTETE